jgi:N-acetylmuramic acid 6-phosphate etherase
MWYRFEMVHAVRQTEVIEKEYAGIDAWPDAQILEALQAGQERAISSVRRALPAISKGAEVIAARLQLGGKLFYAGAGSSIRLSVLDGSELPATYDIPESQLGYLIAGGKEAIFETLADKEDSVEDGIAAASACGKSDAIICVAASGRTPYTVAAAEEARSRGAIVIAIVNVPNSPLGKVADVEIVLQSGAEVIAGSTRMGAGTAQKAALNLLSTLTCIKLGGVYDGMMVAMRPENGKLRERAATIVSEITGVTQIEAAAALAKAGKIKPAILLCAGAKSPEAAARLLAGSHNNLRLALAQLGAAKT